MGHYFRLCDSGTWSTASYACRFLLTTLYSIETVCARRETATLCPHQCTGPGHPWNQGPQTSF